MRFVHVLSSLALMAQSVVAQSPAVTAIRATRLIIGDGTQVESPVVVITGERITAAGPAAQVRVPAGARVIDLTGYTLMPGFFDMHTHITSIDNDGGDLSVLKETAAHGAIYAVINAKKTLETVAWTSWSVPFRGYRYR